MAEIIQNYEKFMNLAMDRGLTSREDVLKPAFVFKLANGELRFYRSGEAVPNDAQFFQGVLSSEFYNKMLANGFFPMGGSQRATPGRRSPN